MAGEQLHRGEPSLRRVDRSPLNIARDVPDSPGRRTRWEMRLNDNRAVSVFDIRSARLLTDMAATPTGSLTTAQIAERFNFSDFKGLDKLVTTTQEELALSGLEMPFSPQGFSLRDATTRQRLRVMQTSLILEPPLPYEVIESRVATGDPDTIGVLRRVDRILRRRQQTPETIRELHGIVSDNREILLGHFLELPGYRNVFDALRDSATITPVIETPNEESLVRVDTSGNFVYREGSRLAALSEPATIKKPLVQKRRPRKTSSLPERRISRDPNMVHVPIADRKDGISFDRRRKDIVVINSEKRDVEPLELFLKNIRQRFGLSMRGFAKFAEISVNNYVNAELGISTKIARDTANHIIDAAKRLTGEGDNQTVAIETYLAAMDRVPIGPQSVRKKEQLRDEVPFHGLVVFQKDGEVLDFRTEGQKWYAIFDDPAISRHETVRYIRLANCNTRNEFAERTGIHLKNLINLETEDQTPAAEIQDKLITTANLSLESPEAQRLRMKLEDMDVMTVDRLRSVPPGELLRYMRIALGFTQEGFGRFLGGLTRRTVIKIEKNEPISPKVQKYLVDQRLLPPIYSGLRKVFQHKFNGSEGEIGDDVIAEVLQGRILFQDATPRMEELQPPDWMTEAESSGELLTELRGNISQRELARRTVELTGRSMSQADIYKAENMKKRFLDYKTAALMRGLGYRITDSETRFVLSKIEEERVAA